MFWRRHMVSEETARKLIEEIKKMANLADLIIDTNTKVTALQAAIAALPTTASSGGLSAADEATLNTINTNVQTLAASFTPTPATQTP